MVDGCRQPGEPEPTSEAAPGGFETQTPTATLKLRQTAKGVEVILPWKGGEVWRGHELLTFHARESRVQVPVGVTILDTPVPDGRPLYYLAQSPEGVLAAGQLETSPVPLPAVSQPRLVVDKLHYTLSVLDGDTVVKRYRVGLGGDPVKRKICQDNLTTPEGLFTIYNLQPQATFHKAYDVDYPTAVDQRRYRIGQAAGLVASDRPIGGEIQIHGCGSFGNWTAGCIALEDEDIDELFEHPELNVGMELFVCGSEIKPQDRPWLLEPPHDKVRTVQSRLRAAGLYAGAIDGQLGDGTQEALGRYQAAQGLPLTCQLDSATRAHFKL